MKGNENLNEKEKQLVDFCQEGPKFIKDIAKHLGIALKNVYTKVHKLEQLGKIKSGKEGGKTYVTAINRDKIDKYVKEILKLIRERGDSVNMEEYSLLPFYDPDPINDPEGYQKQNANFYVLWKSGFVRRKVELTEQGKKFLEENK